MHRVVASFPMRDSFFHNRTIHLTQFVEQRLSTKEQEKYSDVCPFGILFTHSASTSLPLRILRQNTFAVIVMKPSAASTPNAALAFMTTGEVSRSGSFNMMGGLLKLNIWRNMSRGRLQLPIFAPP